MYRKRKRKRRVKEDEKGVLLAMDTKTSSKFKPLKSSDLSSEIGLLGLLDITSKEVSDKSRMTNGKMIFGTHLNTLSSFSKSTPANDQNTPDHEIPMAITASEILLPFFSKSTPANDQNTSDHEIPMAIIASEILLPSFSKSMPANDQNTPDQEISMTITASEIWLSEEYTRVTCYGPNPRITRIFRDFSLECRPDRLIFNSGKKREDVMSLFNQVDICSYPSVELLNLCEACNEKFKEGEDLYKYRGKSLFCSSECLAVGILAEEISKAADKSLSFSSDEERFKKPFHCRGKSSFCSSDCQAIGILAEEISKAADKSLSFSSDDELIFLLDH
ncbi:hypothetical protein Vadar_030836 [Vaccinium darrowii]|uniref:Uncharacterized protein n=1 Tax=Vaccinium darrowii TaxID=229202 RepID=A0ACB7ZMG0_9ERIC|nr:hypothetical protein Vadar_030836 [Vaccinium darrowii]